MSKRTDSSNSQERLPSLAEEAERHLQEDAINMGEEFWFRYPGNESPQFFPRDYPKDDRDEVKRLIAGVKGDLVEHIKESKAKGVPPSAPTLEEDLDHLLRLFVGLLKEYVGGNREAGELLVSALLAGKESGVGRLDDETELDADMEDWTRQIWSKTEKALGEKGTLDELVRLAGSKDHKKCDELLQDVLKNPWMRQEFVKGLVYACEEQRRLGTHSIPEGIAAHCRNKSRESIRKARSRVLRRERFRTKKKVLRFNLGAGTTLEVTVPIT